MNPEHAISITGLHKAYGDQTVLAGLDLEVRTGSVYAMLGPNGAGKTTAVRIMTTLIGHDGGAVRVAGHDVDADPDAVRAAIGVTGQFSAVDDLLTGRENLVLMADLHHLPRDEGRRRADELLEQFDLVESGSKRAAAYSGGMRRRLDLAMTLVARPRIIFLDEPTTGLDPRSRLGMWQIIRELVADGVTIFLTTQYLDEADELATRIGVLDHGRLVAEGTPEELKRLVPGSAVRLEFAGPEIRAAAAAALALPHPDDAALDLRVPTDGSVGALRDLLAVLDNADVEVTALSVLTADLDDVFLTLTEKELAR